MLLPLEVYDWDRVVRDDFIGECSVNLNDLDHNRTTTLTLNTTLTTTGHSPKQTNCLKFQLTGGDTRAFLADFSSLTTGLIPGGNSRQLLVSARFMCGIMISLFQSEK